MNALRVAWAAAGRFRGDPWLRGYCLGKSVLDPAYAFLVERLLAADRPVLDIGCGAGAFAACLRASGFRGAIRGLDPDAAKVRAARLAVPDGEFTVGDAAALPTHTGDVVALDVLHYIAPERRADFFQTVAACLGNEGTGYVRTTLSDNSWRYRATRLEEIFVRVSGWIPYRSNRFPSREEIERDTAGLTRRIVPMYGSTPFNSHLIEISNTDTHVARPRKGHDHPGPHRPGSARTESGSSQKSGTRAGVSENVIHSAPFPIIGNRAHQGSRAVSPLGSARNDRRSNLLFGIVTKPSAASPGISVGIGWLKMLCKIAGR